MSGQKEGEPRTVYTIGQVSQITGLKASEIRYLGQLGLVTPGTIEEIGGKWYKLDAKGQPGEEVQLVSREKVRELREERLRRKTSEVDIFSH